MSVTIRRGLAAWLLPVCLVAAVAAALLFVLPLGKSEIGPAAIESYPPIFRSGAECPDGPRAEERARRAERQGRLHMQRYPYDPWDGVRAVARLREAEACYRAASDPRAAERARGLAGSFQRRVETDFASSRLVLRGAIEEERWDIAHVEINRLLRLTRGVRDHDYVRWLTEVAGKAAVNAPDTH